MKPVLHTPLSLLPVLLLSLPAYTGPATADSTDLQQVIHTFANRIYALGETTGGSPQEWEKAEQTALEQMHALASTNPELLVKPDKNGDTPLMRAASFGHAFIVRDLLKSDTVVAGINQTGRSGISAYDHALIAFRQTRFVCNPALRNDPWKFIPFMVTQPYYENRAPYPAIAAMLVAAGADPGQERVKSFWL
jgi:hypothetical protein